MTLTLACICIILVILAILISDLVVYVRLINDVIKQPNPIDCSSKQSIISRLYCATTSDELDNIHKFALDTIVSCKKQRFDLELFISMQRSILCNDKLLLLQHPKINDIQGSILIAHKQMLMLDNLIGFCEFLDCIIQGPKDDISQFCRSLIHAVEFYEGA